MNFFRYVKSYIHPVPESIDNHGETTNVDTGLTRESVSRDTTAVDPEVLPAVLHAIDNPVLP